MRIAIVLQLFTACGHPDDDPSGAAVPPAEVPLVSLQGELLGVGETDDPWLDAILDPYESLNEDYTEGFHARVYLAAAFDPADLDASPKEGASVALCATSAEIPPYCGHCLTEGPKGEYVWGDCEIVHSEYADLEVWPLEVDVENLYKPRVPVVQVALPTIVAVDVPAEQPVGQPLELSIHGQGFQSVRLAVLGLDGSTLWSNEVHSRSELEAANAPESVDWVLFPAEAFAQPGEVALGIAGMTRTHPADVEALGLLDPSATQMRAGRMALWRVVITQSP